MMGASADAGEARGVVAPPERIEAWLAVARAGDEFVYASRCWLPPGSTGAELARALSEQGAVYLFQRPVKGRTERNYVMQRSSRPLAGRVARAPEPASESVDRDSMCAGARRVFNVLDRFARNGRPCPTNAQIAERADIGRDRVADAIEDLRAGGLIDVRPAPAPTLRVVTIIATKASTGMLHGRRR